MECGVGNRIAVGCIRGQQVQREAASVKVAAQEAASVNVAAREVEGAARRGCSLAVRCK